MSEQLNSVKKENNFQNCIQIQKKILESIAKNNVNLHYNNKTLALLTLDELFEFLEAHFHEFYESTNFDAIVPFIHRGLEVWSNNWDISSGDIGITLLFLLENHTDDENAMAIVVRIINTILNFLKSMEYSKDIQISRKVFMQLTKILPTINNGKLIPEIIGCLKLYMEMYPDNRRDIITTIWSDLSQRLIVQTPNTIATEHDFDILIHFYDEFYVVNPNIFEDLTLTLIDGPIQQLLRCEQTKNRKRGFYLFRKMIDNLVIQLKKLTGFVQTSQIEQLWTSYVNIYETLEGEQSDVIKPCLENLETIVQSKQLQKSWVEILYTRLLTHSNIDVLYCVMEFFLKTFSYSDLSTDIIGQLLKASNSYLLYNHEGYFLDAELFKLFLKGDLTKIYELMLDIEWKSIPLFIWIKALYDNEKEVTTISITFEQLLKLSSRVGDLDSLVIRREITKLFKELFKTIINNMSMKEYVEYVETLYTKTTYDDFEIMYGKISHLQTDDIEYVFSQRVYQIFLKNLPNTNIEVNRFINFLNDLPEKQLGWLKFIPYHYFGNINDENIQKLNIVYGINASTLKTCKLTEIITKFEQYFLPNLLPSDNNQEEFFVHCRLAAISFYIQQKNSFDQIDRIDSYSDIFILTDIQQKNSFDEEDDETLKIIFNPDISVYNNMIELPELWDKLCECLQNTNKTLETWIIDEFLKRICDNIAGYQIFTYLCRTYDENTKNKYFEMILNEYPHNFANFLHNYVNPLKLSNQSRFFNGDLEKDEFRIEQLFCYDQFDTYAAKPISFLKIIWINGLSKYCDEEYILYLLNYHKMLSEKKPIYDENSTEHLIKLRIAFAILKYGERFYTTEILNEIWNILLNEYNQLNICYIYETIVSVIVTRVDMILEKLKLSHSLTSTQQITVISVAFRYFTYRPLPNSESGEMVITNLISLLMCNNSETRMFAQKALYKLLKTENFKKILRREQILQSIEYAMGPKSNENLNDCRLHYHATELELYCHIFVLFVTKAPFDPKFFVYYSHFFNSAKFYAKIENYYELSLQVKDNINKCQEAFLERYNKMK